MTQPHQKTTNTTAHGASSAEEAKWRHWNENPALLADPYDVAEAARARREALAEFKAPVSVDADRHEMFHRPLGALVAQEVMQDTPYEHNPATLAVQKSFER